MNIGVIGLGSMGGGVTKNLLNAGYHVNVMDAVTERMELFSKQGATAISNYTEMGKSSDVVFTFLPMSPFEPTLENVVLGENGLLENMKEQSILIDCGNTSPNVARLFDQRCKEKNVKFLDAPVSGGPEGAEAGSLSMMVGGDLNAYDKCAHIFEVISSKFNYFGPAGSGHLAKLVNNMIVANNLATISEALVFATKAGLNPRQLLQAMSEGAANSWVLRTYGQIILDRPFKGSTTPGGGFSGRREGGRDKQLAWALQMAEDLETPLPVTSVTYQMFQMARGLGKSGLCEPIIDMLEDMGKTVVLENNDKNN